MTQDAILFAAIAAALTLGVLAFVLRPLWGSSGSRVALSGLAGGLALATFALYGLVGTPAALEPTARETPQTLDAAIAQLEAQLQRDPEAVEGWRLLGLAYATAERPDKANDAFARAVALAPDDPDVLVEAAEWRAQTAPGHRFDATAIGWLGHAVEVQPGHQRARWFLGVAQRQSGDAAAAARTWEPLLAAVDPRTAAPLREQIDAARADAGLPPLPAPADTTTVAPAHAVQVRVSLDPDLAGRLRLGGRASVFVIARVPDGPPMPVAAEKRAASGLPFTVTLDDADSPMPTLKLSQVEEVELVARLSASGDAAAQPGDPESAPVRIRLPVEAPVELVIGAAP